MHLYFFDLVYERIDFFPRVYISLKKLYIFINSHAHRPHRDVCLHMHPSKVYMNLRGQKIQVLRWAHLVLLPIAYFNIFQVFFSNSQGLIFLSTIVFLVKWPKEKNKLYIGTNNLKLIFCNKDNYRPLIVNNSWEMF